MWINTLSVTGVVGGEGRVERRKKGHRDRLDDDNMLCLQNVLRLQSFLKWSLCGYWKYLCWSH